MTLGERLREERKRLGLTQPELGDAAGTTKQTVFSWETGKSAPDGFQLSVLTNVGVDVLYVLTGQRSVLLLTDGDRVLLDNFHAAPAQVREGVKTTLGAFAPSADGAASDRPAAKRGKAA